LSEHTERTTAAPGPAGPPGAPGSVSPPGTPGPASPPGAAAPASPPGPATSAPASGTDVQRAHRQRRPTGAPPPLPHPITISTTAWLILAVIIVTGAFLISEQTPWLRVGDRANTWILRLIAEARTPWLTDIARAIKVAGSSWAVTVIGLSVVALTLAFRRWRHLFVFLGSFFFLGIVTEWIYSGLSRPRPYGITILSSWGGYSAPSPPVATLTIVLMGAVYCLVVPGRPRTYAKIVVAVVITLFCLARVYLAVDHPDDVLFGVALGVAIPVTAFRWFTPNEVFPVVYRRGRTAHVDVTGRRGAAIRTAVHDQLGLNVLEIKPVGLESSAGSTPLRLRVEGGDDEYLFAKLYTKGHVRADRWYKLWRTILYGTLEDESPFQTVRRLTEYEDHMLRLLRDDGIRTARPYGIVEITPEREYMIITQFFMGAVEIGEAVIDDGVIDQGLLLVRKLWDAGLAHRDIKPGNLMVRDGELLLIDVAFVQVRPSPWRQAVDLGNMMLVLAVRTDPERVYRRALQYFTPDELSEAFAATRGAASPTQLRAFMKRDPRDLLGEFRALAPPRKPIVLQRWSVRRVGLAVAMFGGIVLAVAIGVQAFIPAANAGAYPPVCGTGHSMILAAQAVPSASMVPCVSSLPAGWQVGGADIASGHSRFWLNSDQAGDTAVTITLSATCNVSGAREIPSDQPGARRFERPLSLRPQFTGLRFYVFRGGCATYRFNFAPGKSPLLAIPVDSAVAFWPRSSLVDHIRNTEGLALCGLGAPCPG
jgi:membrane-associated phospholipid phosphatase